MSPPRSLLARMLAQPPAMASLDLRQWDLLLRQARRADLLPRLAIQVEQHLGRPGAPEPVVPHLQAALTMQRALAAEVQREADDLEQVLLSLNIPVVVLKGGAYLLSEGPAACGRTLTDLDILVPQDALASVESALLIGGWHTTHHHPYDQQYYRRWMHELPPMVHVRRGTALDVHHAILPPTARSRPDSRLILRAAQPLMGRALLRVPSPVDQVLHSMAHLLFNEDLQHGLRDLSDIDLLLRSQGHQSTFWEDLFARAQALDLQDELVHGLLQAIDLLQTPVAREPLFDAMRRRRFDRPIHRLLRRLWNQALDVHHDSHMGVTARAAALLLFIRAHALRMPAPLLIRHLSIKASRRLLSPPALQRT